MTDKRNFLEVANNDDPLICGQCLEEWPIMIILKENLWLSIAEKQEFLCKGCIEERLGRPLTGWDLMDVPLNHRFWPELMYDVIQHTSYAEAYRRIFLDNPFDELYTLLGIIWGYIIPSHVGFDNDDPLRADRVFSKGNGPEEIKRVRCRFGLDEPANDNSGLDQSTG